MLGSLATRLRIAEEVADNTATAPADRIRALEFLARYGLGTRDELAGDAAQPLTIRVVREGAQTN
jgi:hypothetical protein